jgi:radical SAM family RiPP maturation amino acid epimerase
LVVYKDELKALLNRVQELLATGDIELIYLNRHQTNTIDHSYRRELAEIKRFLERWSADTRLREALKAGAEEAAGSMGLSVDTRQLKYLWDAETALSMPVKEIPLSALRYRAFILEKITHRNQMRNNHPDMDPRFAAWRTRQMRRAENQLSSLTAGSIVHAPFCIELCQGCSVGCWFCGISAPRLGDIFLRTPENTSMFAGVVEALKRFFGSATGRGFLYWATDPFDNPDYERFMTDFHGLTGAFPQTTTALALKDLERTRAFLDLSRTKGGMVDRFSLLSLTQLAAVHREFSPEELLYVELITQNREGHQPKAKAGRALTIPRKTASRQSTRPAYPGEQAVEGTIACVSGFLINLVQHRVKLISPCEASQRWPLGYIVYGEGRFRTLEEFSDLLERLVDEHMSEALRGDEPLSFYDYLKCEEVEGGIRLSSRHRHIDFTDNPAFAAVVRAVRESPRPADELVLEIASGASLDPSEVLYVLNLLFANGVLEVVRAETTGACKEVAAS